MKNNLHKKLNYNEYYHAYNEITIEQVKNLLHSKDLNSLLNFYSMMLKRDLHLYSQVNKRQTQLLACKLKTTYKRDEHKNLYQYLFNTKLNTLLKNIVIAISYGFVVIDMVWKYENNYFFPDFYLISPCAIYNDSNNLYIYTDKLAKTYLEDSDKFFIHAHAIESDYTEMSILRKIIWAFALKNYVIAHYAKYVNLLSVPPIIIQSDNDASNIVDAVIDLRSASVAAFPSDAIIKLLEGKADITIFQEFIKYIDNAISVTICGSTLTSVVEKGSYAAAKVHNDIRNEYLYFDASLIESSLNNLIKKIHKFNFNDIDYPEVSFDTAEYIDEKTRAETLLILSNFIKIPEQYIYDSFNIQKNEHVKNKDNNDYKQDDDIDKSNHIDNPEDTSENVSKNNFDKQELCVNTADKQADNLNDDLIYNYVVNANFSELEKEILNQLIDIFSSCKDFKDAFNSITKIQNLEFNKFVNELSIKLFNAHLFGVTDVKL